MAEQFGDKTQEATPYRRQKAREEGQVPHSQDLSSAALLVGATATLMYFGRPLFHFLATLTEQQLGTEAWLQTDVQTAALTWNAVVVQLARVLAPIFGLLMLLAVASHLSQVGLLYLPGKLMPDFSRVDPLKGAQRLFSLSNVVRSVSACSKWPWSVPWPPGASWITMTLSCHWRTGPCPRLAC